MKVFAGKLRRYLSWFAVALAIWWLLSWIAARALIIEGPSRTNADAIVVMSGSAAIKERAEAAAQLFRESKAPLVLLTNDGQQGGWSTEKQRNPYSYERATDELVRLGVPQSSIRVLPDVVTNTYDECVVLGNWMNRERVGSVFVVTSGYHSRRTRWTLERTLPNDSGFAVVPVPPGKQTPTPATWWWYRSGWSSVAHEYIKFLHYLLVY
ncbi:MAG TPA: YdcF family protein [Pyrinomonadaceae bacterium]|jgi:uncharacterized SAM-binding protein YcdF (DUF218 family)|nr:YdcF family protein [Pyrinomonadaceae bacterium]